MWCLDHLCPKVDVKRTTRACIFQVLFESVTFKPYSITEICFFASLNFIAHHLWDVLIITTTIVQQRRNNDPHYVLCTFLFTEFVTVL